MHLQVQVWQCKVIILAPRAEKNTANLWMDFYLITKIIVNVTSDQPVLSMLPVAACVEALKLYLRHRTELDHQ